MGGAQNNPAAKPQLTAAELAARTGGTPAADKIDPEKMTAEEKAAIDRAASANAELAKKIGQPADKPSPIESLAGDGEAMVSVSVPKAFNFRPDHHRVVQIPMGIVSIPQSLVDHWWFKAQGVKAAK